MTEFEEWAQPQIDRVGAIALSYDPKCKIRRYKTRIVLKKNFLTKIIIDFDMGEINGVSHKPIGVVSSILSAIFYRTRWVEDIYHFVYTNYNSDKSYSKEISEFAKKYNTYYTYGPTSRNLLKFFGFFAVLLICLILFSFLNQTLQTPRKTSELIAAVSAIPLYSLILLIANRKRKVCNIS